MLAIFVAAVLAFRMTGEYSWLDSVWMVVVTISTVGYAEESTRSASVQIICILLILTGVTAGAYTFGGFVQLMLEGELERVLGTKRMKREIDKLSGHVIICGFGRLGEDLGQQLSHRNIPFVVIDTDEEKVGQINSQQQLALLGDATLEDTLEKSGIKRARAIVSALPTDAENVFIALTARNLCPNIQIIAKSEQGTSCRKLRQAGANKIVMPHRVGAQQMERMISRPTAADLIDLFAEASELEMELDEITVSSNSFLSGKAVKDSKIKEEYGLLLVGIKKPNGEMVFNPAANYVFGSKDVLLVMGRTSEIQRLQQRTD